MFQLYDNFCYKYMSDKKQILPLEHGQNYFQSKLTFRDRVFKSILGSRVLFNIRSMQNLNSNKQHYPQVKSDIQTCERTVRNSGVTALFLCGALALSLRRYFSNVYSKLSLTMIACDLTLFTSAVIFGAIYGINSSSQKLDLIRTTLIRERNAQFHQFMRQFSQTYHISYKHISRIIGGTIKQADSLLNLIEQKQLHDKTSSINKNLIL